MRLLAVKVKRGKANVFDASTGKHLHSLSSQVVSALINGPLVQVTKADGSVALYNANTGDYVRTL